MVSAEYSVARHVRLRNASGGWQPLCCVLTSLAAPSSRGFVLLPFADTPKSVPPNRAGQLEQHLLRIAQEVLASGILERIGQMPSPAELPQLSELTTRQWDVLARLMRGQRIPTIAAEMFVSQSTIRNHLSAIFKHFGVHTQAELLALLSRH